MEQSQSSFGIFRNLITILMVIFFAVAICFCLLHKYLIEGLFERHFQKLNETGDINSKINHIDGDELENSNETYNQVSLLDHLNRNTVISFDTI